MTRAFFASLDARIRRRLGATGQGAAVIVVATAAAQGIAALGYPLVSRLYTPHDFGTLSTVTAWSMLLMPIMALRADALVPLPPSEAAGRRIVRRGVKTVVVTTVLNAAIVAAVFLAERAGDLGVWIFAIPVVSALMALFQLANAWAIRQRRYQTIAGRNVIQALVTIITQVAIGLVAATAFGLIAGLVLAFVLSTLFLAVAKAPEQPPEAAPSGDSDGDISPYTRQAPALALAGSLNAAGLYAPPLLVAAYFGLAAAGQFGLAQRIVAIPVALVGQAAAQVYLGWLSEHKRAGRFVALPALRKATRYLLLAALPLGLAGLLAAPWAFPLVFGEPWRPAGSMAAALSVNLAAQLVASPVSQTLIVLGHARIQLAWDAARLTLVVGSLLVCVHYGADAVTAVWAFSLASAAAYVLSWGLSRWAAGAEGTKGPDLS